MGATVLTKPDVRAVAVWIYGLACPFTGEIRYVGKSCKPHYRLRQHLARPTFAVGQWLADLEEQGAEPKLVLLYEVPPGSDGARRERHFIEEYGARGRLLNFHIGVGRIHFAEGHPWRGSYHSDWESSGDDELVAHVEMMRDNLRPNDGVTWRPIA